MERFLNELVERTRPRTGEGRTAAYIPELKKQDPSLLGVDLLRPDGSHLSAGDWDVPFTIQSIIKPVILLLALMDNGIAGVRRCIGVEATGRPFDAINLSGETLSPQHFNPMVNMGAILLCTQLRGRDYGERFDRLLALTRKLAGSDAIAVDEAVYRSEKATGSKNRALCYLLKANGLISDPAEAVLDCYFRACSIRVTCRDLSRIAMVLASHGRSCPGPGRAPFPGGIRPVRQRHPHHLRDVRRVGGLRRPGGGPGQKRRGRRHPGSGPGAAGHRHLWPGAGRAGQQRGGDGSAGGALGPAGAEHLLTRP